MKKKMLVLLGSFILLAGCASPEVTEETVMQGTNDVAALQSDQGRHITKSITVQYGTIKIDADVEIPQTTIEKGTIVTALPEIEKIEELFADGAKMEQTKSGNGSTSWQIPSEDGSEDAFKLYYTIDEDTHYAHLDNASVKSLGVLSSETVHKNEDECSEAELQVLDGFEEKGQSVLEALGIQSKILQRGMNVVDNYYEAELIYVSTLDDMLLIRNDLTFAANSISILDEGVESFNVSGNFEKGEAEEVKVLSVDEALTILESRAIDGSVAVPEPIHVITLAYYLDFNSGIFYPVWCFYGDMNIPCVCINAETGAVISASSDSGATAN